MTDSYRHAQQGVQAWRNMPVSDDVLLVPPSPVMEGEPAPQNIQAGLVIVVSANFAVMTVVIGGMLFGGTNPVAAILAGVGYFTVTSPLYLAIVTGVLTALVGRREREVTERLRVLAYRELGELAIGWRLSVEETRQMELVGRRPPTDSVQRISPLNTYVAPIADGEEAQVEGVRFAMGLYDTGGRPDPKRVQSDGRLKIKMLGSKRGSGSREAGKWLLRERIITRVPGGYALNVGSYPIRDSLRHLL